MRDEKAEIPEGRSHCHLGQRHNGSQVNIDGRGLTGRGRSRGGSKRTVPLHPGLVVVSGRSLGRIVAFVMMMMARALE